ncbi:MAG: type II toxin-antitoxin system ParD family antitoxin [Thermomicrobiales bacterium]
MNVSLTPQLETMVRQKVESGRYNNASEVVREALRLMEEHDRLKEFRTSLAVAEEQIRQGEGIEWTPAVMERLKREAAENARMGKPVSDDVKP